MDMACMLCVMAEGDGQKLIAVSPADNYWFVERELLQGDIADMAAATEERGTVSVIGVLMKGDTE